MQERKLDDKLIERLLKGDYKKILSVIRKDPDLTLEIRSKKAEVYHHKKLILTLSSKSDAHLLADGYIKPWQTKPILDLQDPAKYFRAAKDIVRAHSKQSEFMVQQNIATSNQSQDNKYFVVDMEYAFSQETIPKGERLKRTRIDLVAIENSSNDIVLFELKYGLQSCRGNSGVDSHYVRLMNFLANETFCNALKRDISNIIADKKKLNLIKFNNLRPLNEVKMKYIFAYISDEELNTYREQYADKYQKMGIETIYVDTRYIIK